MLKDRFAVPGIYTYNQTENFKMATTGVAVVNRELNINFEHESGVFS